MRLHGLWISVAASLICVSNADADTLVTWNGGTGSWSTSSNWTPPAVPNNSGSASYSVTIGSGGTDLVTIDMGPDPTVDSLTLGGSSGTATLHFSLGIGHGLTVTNGMTVNQTGDLNFGSYPNPQNVPYSGSLTVGGTLTNAGSVSLYPGSLSAGNVINSGTLFVLLEPPSGVQTQFSVPGTLTNSGVLQLGVANGPSQPTTTIGTLANTGTVQVSGGLYQLLRPTTIGVLQNVAAK